MGLNTLEGKQKIAADINQERTVAISDVVSNLRHNVGFDEIEQCALVDSSDELVTSMTTSTLAILPGAPPGCVRWASYSNLVIQERTNGLVCMGLLRNVISSTNLSAWIPLSVAHISTPCCAGHFLSSEVQPFLKCVFDLPRVFGCRAGSLGVITKRMKVSKKQRENRNRFDSTE